MHTANRLLLGALLAAVVPLAAAQAPPPIPGVVCRGEEPFWSLDAGRATAVYTELAARGRREVVFRGSLQTLSYLSPPVIVWRGDSTHLPRETLVATVREEACKSTMADTPAFAYSVVVSLRSSVVRSGCCSLRTGSEPKPRAGARPAP